MVIIQWGVAVHNFMGTERDQLPLMMELLDCGSQRACGPVVHLFNLELRITGGRGTLLTHLTHQISLILFSVSKLRLKALVKSPCQIMQLHLGQPLSDGG